MKLTVVIPTRDRRDSLRECLLHLSQQSLDCSAYNIVIVDDGSVDVLSDSDVAGCNANVRIIRQPRLGPAAARNRGVSSTDGDIIVFIGDDILVPPDFLSVHLRWHQSHSHELEAALGKVIFPGSLLNNPFMRWLETSGMQFGYRGLTSGQRLEYFHFYTANISIKRAVLLRHRFDEDFTTAAYEDSELGVRLQQAGLRLYYEPSALATHHHSYDLDTACEHFRRIGRAGYLFNTKHPGKSNFRWIRRPPLALRILCRTNLYRRLSLFAAHTGDFTPIKYYYTSRITEAFWEGYFGARTPPAATD